MRCVAPTLSRSHLQNHQTATPESQSAQQSGWTACHGSPSTERRVARANRRGDCLMFGRFRRVAGALSAAGMLVVSMNTAPASAGPIESPNLLVNPGAEAGDPSLTGYSSVSVPGWTVTGTPTVVRYSTVAGCPSPLSVPAPPFPGILQFPRYGDGPFDGGAQFFGGGNVATATLSQTVDLSGAAAQIDTGTVSYTLSGWLGGFLEDPSKAAVTVELLSASQAEVGARQ